VGSCQRKDRGVMVKGSFSRTSGMTSVTGKAVVIISCNLIMLAVRFSLGMLMTGNTGELPVIGRVVMTVGTIRPLSFMLP